MDIYSYGRSINFAASYLDMHTGLVYDLPAYKRAKDFGLPIQGIPVLEDGKLIGYAKEEVSE